MLAKLRLELRDRGGGLIATRAAHNAVLTSGATLLARLFAGTAGIVGITHMAVGANDAPEGDGFATATLDTTGLSGATDAPVGPEAFQIDAVDPVKRVVRVRVRATIPANGAIGTIREAALVSRRDDTSTLYNRVIFAPIEKADDHELTLFWEVGFPYGDLQWLL
jgi:hypothetical protein